MDLPHMRPDGATIAPDRVDTPDTDERPDIDKGWNVVVWNDPVNLMSYVVLVFRRVFGYSEEKATRLMLEVHNQGRSIVNTAPREKAEVDCYTLHRYSLWATIERA
ncbi:MAG: ATP-dependent Clp protease adapter ClpS [Acidimicrobiia bacterium]|nr:ATP-dependent Clp protease adapter ClpS [Acidimicrobiia bacterium]MXZ06099.1 ATP-dependent Clp protease adapter ClpS [Acidimicrobiia bacterium]MYF27075.1 ATP-dependent Clp protease adapter ClpS [Acidimicrobiia bacterium]MYH54672.1 ATP-dependent Clp protease adapter ClpS [Acidimicrobiia bacterium]